MDAWDTGWHACMWHGMPDLTIAHCKGGWNQGIYLTNKACTWSKYAVGVPFSTPQSTKTLVMDASTQEAALHKHSRTQAYLTGMQSFSAPYPGLVLIDNICTYRQHHSNTLHQQSMGNWFLYPLRGSYTSLGSVHPSSHYPSSSTSPQPPEYTGGLTPRLIWEPWMVP